MLSVNVIILLHLVVQAGAKELAASHSTNKQNSMDNSGNKLVPRAEIICVNDTPAIVALIKRRTIDRMIKIWPIRPTHLDNTVMGKMQPQRGIHSGIPSATLNSPVPGISRRSPVPDPSIRPAKLSLCSSSFPLSRLAPNPTRSSLLTSAYGYHDFQNVESSLVVERGRRFFRTRTTSQSWRMGTTPQARKDWIKSNQNLLLQVEDMLNMPDTDEDNSDGHTVSIKTR